MCHGCYRKSEAEELSCPCDELKRICLKVLENNDD